jgi:hypothetical protein
VLYKFVSVQRVSNVQVRGVTGARWVVGTAGIASTESNAV